MLCVDSYTSVNTRLPMGNNVVCVDSAPISPFSWETAGFGASGKTSSSTAEPRRLEFKQLNEEKERPCPTAMKLSNQCKNRYCGVNAVEDSRVRLRGKPGEDDYINANYVDGIHKNSTAAYIATQAPLPETFCDFWSMVWDEQVYVLVMLTRLTENCKHKADKYWPTSRRPKTYGDITIKLQSIEKNSRFQYKIKQFSLSRGSETRTIRQYHFLAWPDHGVPSSPLPLLHMIQAVETYHTQRVQELQQNSGTDNPPRSPILVHCSAGIGRTGAFIIIHTALKKLREESKTFNDINMKELVSRIRQQRAGCLTQSSQYLFCFDAVDMGIRLHNAPHLVDWQEWCPDEYVTDEDDNASDGEDWYWETTRNDPALAWRHQSQVFVNPNYSDSSDVESSDTSLKCNSLNSINFLAFLSCQSSPSTTNCSPSASTCVSYSDASSASDLSSSSSVLSTCSDASYGSSSGSSENSDL